MRVTVSIVLMALLVGDLLPAQQPVAESRTKQEISGMPSTSLVEVRIVGGEKLRGHIVSRTESDFTLELNNGRGTQNIAYDRVLSISQVNGGHSHKKWIIIGVVVGALVITVVVIVAVVKTKGPFAL